MSTASGTLTDVTAQPNPPAPAKPAEPAAPLAPPVNPEAAEVGKIILDSGFSKEQVNDLLQAPGALNSLRYMIENDPKQFVAMVERANPQVGAAFLDKVTDMYLERYGERDGQTATPASGAKGSGPSGEVVEELRSLRDQLHEVQSERERERAAAQQATVMSRYNSRVDDLLGQLPKELSLTKAEQKALRSELLTEIQSDPSAAQRASQGNFVDVPMKFQSIVQDWLNDRKQVAEQAKAEREKVSKGAVSPFLAGPAQNLLPQPEMADSWDATTDGLAAALQKAGMS